MADCPLCTDVLLRHIRSGQTYWFCRRCRVEITEQTEETSFPITIDLTPPEIEDSSSLPFHHPVAKSLLPKPTPGAV
jgi:hypothetical protein